MKRAGGYTSYWSAHKRLLLEDSRPLDSSSANRLPPGRHEVRVVEVEWNWGWIRLTLEARASRRITTGKIWARPGDRLWSQLGCTDLVPGKLSAVESRLLDTSFHARVVEHGEVDLRICQDGSLLGVDASGETMPYPDLASAEAHLEENGLRRRAPMVVALFPIHNQQGEACN